MAIGPALAMLGPLAPGLIGAGIGAGVTGLGAAALAKVAKTSLIGGLIGSRLLPPKQSTTTKKPSYGYGHKKPSYGYGHSSHSHGGHGR